MMAQILRGRAGFSVIGINAKSRAAWLKGTVTACLPPGRHASVLSSRPRLGLAMAEQAMLRQNPIELHDREGQRREKRGFAALL
jgi:hypothetical protein